MYDVLGFGGRGDVGGAAAPVAPTFNIVGNSGINQIGDIIAASNQTPIKTYVLAKDVTTQQAFDRNILDNAGLG